jgi:DNA invertase Pin-like site-specific DNA recombinase
VRVAYIRVSKGLPSEAEQRAAIAAASGTTDKEIVRAWVEKQLRKSRPNEPRFPQRDYMLGTIRIGDEVWVARPGIVGASEPDILEFLAAMTEQGGVLCVASTGGRHRYAEGVTDALRLVQEIRADERRAVMAKVRRGSKDRPAGKPAISRERLEAARAIWFDHSVDGAEVARRAGIGQRTLYRYFGKRRRQPSAMR